MQAPQVTGRVKWFNCPKGYGSLVRDDGHGDVFFHHSAVRREVLREGDQVEFPIRPTAKGDNAVDVVLIRPAPSVTNV